MPSLLENQRDILDAIKQLAFDACCPDLPFQPTPDQTTDLTPNEGPAPETWGSEPVADWADWEQLVCGASGAWVDLQVDNARTMQTLLNVGAITVAVIVGFFAVFSLTAISLGTAASIWGGLATLYGTQVFSQAADAMEAERDRIICAIKGEYTNDLRATMQEILPVLAWLGWYQFQAYENIEATIWEGGNPNQGDLTVYRSVCPDCANLPPSDADILWTDFYGWPVKLVTGCQSDRFTAWQSAGYSRRHIYEQVYCNDSSTAHSTSAPYGVAAEGIGTIRADYGNGVRYIYQDFTPESSGDYHVRLHFRPQDNNLILRVRLRNLDAGTTVLAGEIASGTSSANYSGAVTLSNLVQGTNYRVELYSSGTQNYQPIYVFQVELRSGPAPS
jgi:hypothetical protein